MSQTYKEPKCECGHYMTLHTVPAVSPLKLGRCLRLTGWGTERLTACDCEKFSQEKESV